jgi:hypothetical protein
MTIPIAKLAAKTLFMMLTFPEKWTPPRSIGKAESPQSCVNPSIQLLA